MYSGYIVLIPAVVKSPEPESKAALAACEDAAEWQQALLILGFLRSDAVDCDATTMETTMRACGRADPYLFSIRPLQF